MKNTAADIKECLYNIVRIPSITGILNEENAVPDILMEKLAEWPYFVKNPKNLWFEPLKDDPLERINFCAMVRAVPETKRTLILISHHDVVSVEMCMCVDASPFDIEEYTEALRNCENDDDAERDLASGEWIFGRGVSDMKGGMAVQLALLAEYAESPEKLKANVLLMTLADEENNGFGVHQAARMLAAMQEEEELEYIACVDSEPTITNEDKESGRIYTGSIGNATFFAMCIGRNSHVGEYFQGINSALIATKLISEIESDPESSDSWMGKHYSPYTCTRVRNISEGYSVTLPERTAVLFNVLMVQKSPTELMEYFNAKAEAAITQALDKLSARREKMRVKGYSGLPKNRYEPKIVTYPELIEHIQSKNPDMDIFEKQKNFLNSLPADADSQDRGIALANYMLDLAGIEGPFILTGLLSPYCQPRLNKRETPKEKALLGAVEDVIKRAAVNFGVKLIQDEVYEGISDMSEMGYQGTPEDIEVLKGNLIGWGIDMQHPFEDMQKLDIPVVNLGPVGKDAHKLSERVHARFLLEILPPLLKTLCDNIMERNAADMK